MTETTKAQANTAWLRPLALLIGAIETIGLIWLVGLGIGTTDPLGRAIWEGMAMLAAIPYALLALPGIVLAYRNRALPIALALVVAAVPVAMVLWWNA